MNAKGRAARAAACLGAAGAAVLAANLILADDERGDLDARLGRIEDELAVRRVLHDYGYHLDNGDWASYASLFAEKGRWEGGLGAAVGPEAIERMLEESLGSSRESSELHETLHLMTNPRIDIDADGASSVSKYTFVVTGGDESPELRIHAHYRDRLVEEDGEWKILERNVHHDIFRPDPMSDL